MDCEKRRDHVITHFGASKNVTVFIVIFQGAQLFKKIETNLSLPKIPSRLDWLAG
jgi:hypothetical protein